MLTTMMLLVTNILGAHHKYKNPDETIFIWGGDINLKFVQYVAGLTQKEDPQICYMPTASGDNPDNIKFWENICSTLQLDTNILKVWVSSSANHKSFDEILLNSDAIVVGGGNTLNMLGIWSAQGIDKIMKKALKKGIILAGGSAGSICWFKAGISDSRPVSLSIVKGLGFLPYSNCPHYSQESRKNLYHEMIKAGKMNLGYATDELAGILFKNKKAVAFLTQSDIHNSYLVSLKDGTIQETKLKSEIIVRNDALPQNSYTSKSIKKNIKNLIGVTIPTPLNAYVSEIVKSKINDKTISDKEKERMLNIKVEKTFSYKNKIVGIVNNEHYSYLGYTISYFYNNNGDWMAAGEDIGGESLGECEISFREKAKKVLSQIKSNLEIEKQ